MEINFPKPLRVAVYIRFSRESQIAQEPPRPAPRTGEIDYLMMKLQHRGAAKKGW